MKTFELIGAKLDWTVAKCEKQCPSTMKLPDPNRVIYDGEQMKLYTTDQMRAIDKLKDQK